MFKIGSLEKLIHELNRLPGVGPKTAQRLAYHILRTPDLSDKLQEALKLVQENVHQCVQCFSYTDSAHLCRFCSDTHRRQDLLCIVEEPSDIARVESSGVFRGLYHVLHGAISPLDNVGPNNLRIRELMERVDAGLEGAPVPYVGETTDNSGETVGTRPVAPKINEVILALDPDLEGDTTVLYLAKQLQDKDVKITRIASGVPLGSDIDYVDDRTLGRALENRVEL
jgi:recombination protein RecR